MAKPKTYGVWEEVHIPFSLLSDSTIRQGFRPRTARVTSGRWSTKGTFLSFAGCHVPDTRSYASCLGPSRKLFLTYRMMELTPSWIRPSFVRLPVRV